MAIGFERNFIKAPCAKEILFQQKTHLNPTKNLTKHNQEMETSTMS
jgi:hypothetical protein